MVSLPRPKLFRRKRSSVDKPNPLARFAQNVSTFFAAIFVSSANKNEDEPGSSSSTSSVHLRKRRESIVKRFRKAR